MHTEVSQFLQEVKDKYNQYFTMVKVLEVGSLDINGSVRGFFRNCDYTGLDLGEGKGVDVVCPIHEYKHPGVFDTVVSTEMLEHDKHWQDSLHSMYENLKPKGLLILTCAGPTRHEHGTTRTTPGDAPFTNDYYRNISVDDFLSVLGPELFDTYLCELRRADTDLVFYGIKK